MHVHQFLYDFLLRGVGFGKPDGLLPNQWTRVLQCSQYPFHMEGTQTFQRPQGMDSPLRRWRLAGKRSQQGCYRSILVFDEQPLGGNAPPPVAVREMVDQFL